MTVDKTGVITYYAVTLDEIDYTVTDMYDTNSDYTERTFLELETRTSPILKSETEYRRPLQILRPIHETCLYR